MEQVFNPYYIDKLDEYYKDNARKLHSVVHQILRKYSGGIKEKDLDHFYSIANNVFADIVKNDSYDPSRGDFNGFLYSLIKNKFVDDFHAQNADKRVVKIEKVDENGDIKRIPVQDVRLDAPIKDGEDMTYGDTIQFKPQSEDILYEGDWKVEKYLSSLPKTTRKIIELKMDGWKVVDIKGKLNITESEYQRHMETAKKNQNISLFTKQSNKRREEYKMNIIPIGLLDNYRMDKFPLGGLLDDMEVNKINKNHPLQRAPFQWSEQEINKFLTRVLNSQPIPEIVICEQEINGKKRNWLIDGLQRLSYSSLYRADGFEIKKNGAELYEIPYEDYQYDENGKIAFDDDGDPIYEVKVCNVIGKKFSELPEYLRKKFNSFNINVTTFFDCTDELISYHMRNYNNQEGMNKSQYEVTSLDVEKAENVKKISKTHPFFKDKIGKYTDKNSIKGDIDKVVMESIMSINFLDNWKKEPKDSFAYVNANATEEMFDSLTESLDRLCNIVDKEIRNMFTTTNSPVWFAVFEEFKKLNIQDNKFKEFVKYVDENLEKLNVEGEKFVNTYKSRNTRDKKIVIGKIKGLIKLMYEFLQTEKIEEEPFNIEEFIVSCTGIDKTSLDGDIDFYNESLDDLEERTIKDGSKLLQDGNRASLLAMVVYSYQIDKDLDDWLTKYAKKNNTYFRDQKKNYLNMKNDFIKYCKIKENVT